MPMAGVASEGAAGEPAAGVALGAATGPAAPTGEQAPASAATRARARDGGAGQRFAAQLRAAAAPEALTFSLGHPDPALADMLPTYALSASGSKPRLGARRASRSAGVAGS